MAHLPNHSGRPSPPSASIGLLFFLARGGGGGGGGLNVLFYLPGKLLPWLCRYLPPPPPWHFDLRITCSGSFLTTPVKLECSHALFPQLLTPAHLLLFGFCLLVYHLPSLIASHRGASPSHQGIPTPSTVSRPPINIFRLR